MDWGEQKLSLLCDMFTDGDWVESKDQSAEGIRLIQTGNVGEGVFKNRRDKSRFISEDTFNRLKCTEIIEGDCLVSRLPDPVGRSCLIPNTGDRMITAVDCTIIRLNKSRLLPEFFTYFTQSYSYLNTVESLTSGATRTRISRKNLGEVPIPLPPIPEQQRIVAILDQAFADIEKARANAEKNLKNARELFDSYLNQVFSQRGEGWVENKLGDVCRLINGRAYKKHEMLPEGPYPILRVGNFFTNRSWFYSDLELHEDKYCDYGDLLYAWSASFGPRIWNGDKVIYHYHIWKIDIDATQVDKSYLFYLLEWDTEKIKQTQGTGTTMIHVTKGSMEDRLLPFASLSVQQHIVASLDKLSMEVQQLEKSYQQRLESLDELKKSLLQKAFSGELTKSKGIAV
jgi:type I restriction enzyme S subunit